MRLGSEIRDIQVPITKETNDGKPARDAPGRRVDRLHTIHNFYRKCEDSPRLLDNLEQIRKARVVIVVAGMEGALASVVGGLIDKPIIAVPTSIGYGTSFGGVSALLTMLNSCAPGIAVVNIDNGFGAGSMAHRINILGDSTGTE